MSRDIPELRYWAHNNWTDFGVIDLPDTATEFIFQFDSRRPADRLTMPEISFEVDVPSEMIEAIGIGQAYKILSESKTLELVHP
jgi:hypothetical protein